MIGIDLNLTLPSTTETMATNIARIATALQSIEDSIAEKASPAGININAPLDMQGNALTDVAAVQFASGNIPSTAGSFYYYSGSWYAIDEVGTIQLTENGALKATGFGAIAGDYGGVNPAAVTYVDANGQYVFTEDAGIYADIVCDDLILKGTNGTLTISVDDALTGSRYINVKSLPSAGISLVAYDASTSTLVDNAAVRATNEVLVTALNASGVVTASDFKHSDVTTTLGLDGSWFTTDFGEIVGPGSAISVDPYRVVWTDGAKTLRIEKSLPLKVGDRLKSFTISLNKSNTSATTIEIHKNAAAQSATGDTSVVASGTGTYTVTLSSPAAVVAGDVWSIVVQGPATTGDWYYGAYMVHDRP